MYVVWEFSSQYKKDKVYESKPCPEESGSKGLLA